MKRHITLLGAVIFAAGQAGAAIIAQDDFTYADGTLTGNGAAGSGWAAGWVAQNGTGNVTIAGGAVTDSVSGERASRNLTATQGTDGTTIFIGFDHEFGTQFSAVEFNRTNANDTNFRLEFNSGAPRLTAHHSGGSTLVVTNNVGIRRYVIQIDFGAGNADTATLFDNGVNVGSITPTIGAGTLAHGFEFNQVSFGSFGGGSLDYTDNLVIATTFNEAALIPEPTSIALLGLGGLLCFRRRR